MSQRMTAARYSGARALSASWMSLSRCRSSKACAGRRAAVAQPRGRLLAEPLEPDPLLAARHVQEQVGGYPVQPALEGPRRVAGQRPEDAHEDLLREVLGIVAVPGEPVGEAVNPGGMVPDHVIPAGRRPVHGGSRLWLTLLHGHPLSTAPTLCNTNRRIRASRGLAAPQLPVPRTGISARRPGVTSTAGATRPVPGVTSGDARLPHDTPDRARWRQAS